MNCFCVKIGDVVLTIIKNMLRLCLCLMSLTVGHKGAENTPKHGHATS